MPSRGGGARDGDVRVAVRHLEDADRAEDERARQRRAEHLDRGVARRDVPQHPRDDPPALERRAVLAHRLLRAGAARDVGVSLRRHALCAPPARDARTRPERPDTCPARRRRRSRTVARARCRRTCGHPNRARRENRAAMSSYPAAEADSRQGRSRCSSSSCSRRSSRSCSSPWASTCSSPGAIAGAGSIASAASRADASSTS